MYNDKLLELFDDVKNYGLLRGYNASSQVTCERSGDIVKPYFIIENDKIVDAKFKAFGSLETIVCASYGVMYVIQKTLDEVKSLPLEALTNNCPSIIENDYSEQLVLDAIKQTIEDYEIKLAKEEKKKAKQK